MKKGFFKELLKSAFRGGIKSLPGGNVVTEIITNIKAAKDAAKPHNWYSIAMQVLCIGAIIYAFVSKTITIDELLGYLGYSK